MSTTLFILMQKFEKFGIELPLLYLQRYCQILKIKLKWAFDIEQASVDYKEQIEMHRLDCHTCLAEMIEEIIFVKKDIKGQPESQFRGI